MVRTIRLASTAMGQASHEIALIILGCVASAAIGGVTILILARPDRTTSHLPRSLSIWRRIFIDGACCFAIANIVGAAVLPLSALSSVFDPHNHKDTDYIAAFAFLLALGGLVVIGGWISQSVRTLRELRTLPYDRQFSRRLGYVVLPGLMCLGANLGIGALLLSDFSRNLSLIHREEVAELGSKASEFQSSVVNVGMATQPSRVFLKMLPRRFTDLTRLRKSILDDDYYRSLEKSRSGDTRDEKVWSDIQASPVGWTWPNSVDIQAGTSNQLFYASMSAGMPAIHADFTAPEFSQPARDECASCLSTFCMIARSHVTDLGVLHVDLEFDSLVGYAGVEPEMKAHINARALSNEAFESYDLLKANVSKIMIVDYDTFIGRSFD